MKFRTLRKMIRYYRPYMLTFWIDMAFALIASSITLTIPLIVRYVTRTVPSMEPAAAADRILHLGILMVVLVLIQLGANYYISNQGHVMGAKMEFDMRARLFEHYQKLSFSFYDDQKVGQLMSRLTNDLFDITELMHHGPENIVISLIKITGAFVILSSISRRLMIGAFILLPCMLLYAWWFNKKMRAAYRRNRARIGDINAQIEDNLSGIRVVKSFANETLEEEKFAEGNRAFLAAKKNSYLYMGGYNSGLTAFTMMIQVLVILIGGSGISSGWLEVSDLVTFLLYINIFTDPVKVLIDFTEQFQNGYTGFERYLEMLEIEPAIQDKEGAVDLPAVRGDIRFEDVSFRYASDHDYVLKHIDLTIPAGSYTALVGSSGAGKTTLCNLIPRFYEIEEGTIRMDGFNIQDVTLKSLRDQIGIVQQDVYLFAGTIYDNILYGRPGASREEVIAAARSANAHDFIMSLPEGYETNIGQRGIKLSGGQKQRLSIARVFLKNPPVLIFDEATSALDNESEKIVQDSLERLAKNRTTLVIAHRLSTIRNAQRILVLDEERIAEEGSHSELLARHGLYEHLYNMQFT